MRDPINLDPPSQQCSPPVIRRMISRGSLPTSMFAAARGLGICLVVHACFRQLQGLVTAAPNITCDLALRQTQTRKALARTSLGMHLDQPCQEVPRWIDQRLELRRESKSTTTCDRRPISHSTDGACGIHRPLGRLLNIPTAHLIAVSRGFASAVDSLRLVRILRTLHVQGQH
jgi:hypothetical protein